MNREEKIKNQQKKKNDCRHKQIRAVHISRENDERRAKKIHYDWNYHIALLM